MQDYITKEQLAAAVAAAKFETQEALQLIFDEHNNGQKKQLVKNESIRKLFDKYKKNSYNN